MEELELPFFKKRTRELHEEEEEFFCVLPCLDLLVGWFGFVFDLVKYLLALGFVWLQSHHTSSFPCHAYLIHMMSSFLPCLLSIGWMTSLPLIPLINFLIVCLMTADLLYGSFNFRSRLSFEGSYPGSYYLGSLNLSQYIVFLFMILSYNLLI